MTKMNFKDVKIALVEHKTNKAVLVVLDDEDSTTKWIPLSVLSTEDANNIDTGDADITISVHDWFVDRENLNG